MLSDFNHLKTQHKVLIYLFQHTNMFKTVIVLLFAFFKTQTLLLFCDLFPTHFIQSY